MFEELFKWASVEFLHHEHCCRRASHLVGTHTRSCSGNSASTPHVSRSSFRDYTAEQTHTQHTLMQGAQAQTVSNKVTAAYVQSDLFEKSKL